MEEYIDFLGKALGKDLPEEADEVLPPDLVLLDFGSDLLQVLVRHFLVLVFDDGHVVPEDVEVEAGDVAHTLAVEVAPPGLLDAHDAQEVRVQVEQLFPRKPRLSLHHRDVLLDKGLVVLSKDVLNRLTRPQHLISVELDVVFEAPLVLEALSVKLGVVGADEHFALD